MHSDNSIKTLGLFVITSILISTIMPDSMTVNQYGRKDSKTMSTTVWLCNFMIGGKAKGCQCKSVML